MTPEQAQEEAEILYAKLVSGGDDQAKIQLIQAALLEAASSEDEKDNSIGIFLIALIVGFAVGLVAYGTGLNEHLSSGVGLFAFLGTAFWLCNWR